MAICCSAASLFQTPRPCFDAVGAECLFKVVYHVQLEGHAQLSSLILRCEEAVGTVFVCLRDQDAVNGYEGRFQDESLTERTTTDEYYDLATDFYLYGWGSSFHFATRFLGESLEDSIVRPGMRGFFCCKDFAMRFSLHLPAGGL